MVLLYTGAQSGDFDFTVLVYLPQNWYPELKLTLS